ncbi:MAG: TRAP transporter large permease [Acidiferrobacterales bacterium]|nr:TRAP transporter large permease [Acidiferrobacterales bacterium]
MSGTLIAILGFGSLSVLLLIRMPVGLALIFVGAAGILLIRPQASLPAVASEIFSQASNYSLIIFPLFILMGNLAAVSGMSRDLYAAAQSWFGHLRGGLAITTVVGCAIFSALSGSSLASALTVGRASLPEMQRYRYNSALSTGTVAAGGTLGILIPPSVGFVLYAILTEQSIGRLFIAGIFPGLLLTVLFIFTIWLTVLRNPSLAPQAAESAPIRERILLAARALWIAGIILITIGGIYLGVFSAVEAAGVGASLTLLSALIRGTLNWSSIKDVILDTLQATGTIFLVVFGAFVFKTFIGFTQVTSVLAQWVDSQGFTALEVVVVTLATCIALGTFLTGFAILVLVVPFVLPILQSQGVDLVWFAVLFVLVIEMALISPPVGLNVFAVKSIAPDVPINTIFRGIMPFWLAMAIAIILVIAVPSIATYLPNTMFS